MRVAAPSRSGRRPIGSRPTGVMPSGWRGCLAGEITPTCPGPEEEAARDLVRAARTLRRSDAGSSPALEAAASPRAGVRRDRLDADTRRMAPSAAVRNGPLRSCSTSATGGCLTRRADATRSIRRSPGSLRLRRISMSSAARLSAWRLDADGVRVDGRARRLAPVPSPVAGAVPRNDPKRALKRGAATARRDHQGRQQPRPPAADRGRLAPTQPFA